ncbi:replication factor C subunit 4 [Guillardia theta CCMP2712]|uniref:Replication factor C subunit 4 n=1 Tax=Guillardia theta (strain CCMP2712) TaxID=905079 RepID=L1ILA5_GUITC|nr:replication factor C subunit 4 [Guillardia theta CCMP2712]EKX36580.1 replication factor C subunit 4 [Guillardia theta CCMP2712]|eukprot:XP_005823560.1 replication factor C subunit 4 [Guillardia theta CCMP2712]
MEEEVPSIPGNAGIDPVVALECPWIEKYRPETLNDVVAHKDILTTLDRFLEQDRLPHLLLYGPPGTGKTSTVLALAKKVFGPKYKSMTLELNASDDRGIDVVKKEIKDFAGTRTIFGLIVLLCRTGFKMIILDEADNMTQTAQFALRRIIENYTANARFCLICNYVNKIIPALQSRCTRFRFSPLTSADIQGNLERILDKENIKATPDALKAVEKISGGDMRKCLNILQSSSMASKEVTVESIYECTGDPNPSDVMWITHSLCNDSFEDCYHKIFEIQREKGLALIDIVRAVHEQIIKHDLPSVPFCRLLESLSDLEYRLTAATNEKIQLGSFVGMFGQLKEELASQPCK